VIGDESEGGDCDEVICDVISFHLHIKKRFKMASFKTYEKQKQLQK